MMSVKRNMSFDKKKENDPKNGRAVDSWLRRIPGSTPIWGYGRRWDASRINRAILKNKLSITEGDSSRRPCYFDRPAII
jgi:hypothetical protein